MKGGSKTELRIATVGQTQREIAYFQVQDTNEQVDGYIFSSVDLAPDVRGFAGPIDLAVYINPAGQLLDFHVLRSDETPAYFDLLRDWLGEPKDHELFVAEPFVDVDTVTGVTINADAVLSGLAESAHASAKDVLDLQVQRRGTSVPA